MPHPLELGWSPERGRLGKGETVAGETSAADVPLLPLLPAAASVAADAERRPVGSHPTRALAAMAGFAALLGLVAGVLSATGARGQSWPGGSLYGALVGSWLVAQFVLCHLEWRRQQRFRPRRHTAAITVVIPTYNEPADSLRRCVASALHQEYAGPLEVVVVDDGSEAGLPSLDDLVVALPPHRSLRTLRLGSNQGKRHAQATGFAAAHGEFLVTVDSDTRLHPRAIDVALHQFADPRVGAVTGVALVENRSALLPRLIHLRYWSAFCQERASQSYLGVVTCCSGVFSVYRKERLDPLVDRYVSQRFLGRPCHYGDDRHLTNLLLWGGYEARLAIHALAWTEAPTSVRVWARQQRRWSQSFYREFLWSLRFLHRRNCYFAYCLFFQAALPLLLLYGLAHGVAALAAGDHLVGLRYALTVVLVALLRGGYGLYRTREPDFLLMPLYGFLHLFLIIPVRLLALFTLWDNRWGTR